MDENANSMSEIQILFTISAIIFLSPYIAKIIKIPVSPTEIMLGIIAGNLGFLEHNQLFETVSTVGFYYLMFLAGTEVNLKIFFTFDNKILKKTIIFFVILYILSTILAIILNLNPIFAIAIPAMSIGLLSTLYKDYGKEQIWLNTAMFVGIVGEIISIAILTIGKIYFENGLSLDMFLKIFALCVFLFSATLVFKGLETLFWWYPNLKTIIMPKYDKNEKDIRFATAILFLVVGFVLVLDLEIIIGAFIAGTFIPTFFEYKKDLPQKLSNFGFGFLVPIFFIYTGSIVDIKLIFMPEVIYIMLLIVTAMFSFRYIASFMFLKILNLKNTTLLFLSLSMPLTLLIAIATIGYNAKNISEEIYNAFVLASLCEAVISMILIRIVYNFNKNLK